MPTTTYETPWLLPQEPEHIAFVRALAKTIGRRSVPDHAEADWKNRNVAEFLEPAARWADDIQDTGDERAEWFPETASWHAFARFLCLGKIYE